MAHDQLAFGPHRAAFFQRVAIAAHGVALDAFGCPGLIAQGGGHQAHVVDHHRVAIGAHRFGYAGRGFEFGGDGVGHRRNGRAHRGFAHVGDDADDLPFALFAGDNVIGHVRAPAAVCA